MDVILVDVKMWCCIVLQICDTDNDGLQNDVELNSFQQHCFDVQLQPNVLDEVKAIVRKNVSDGVVNDSITLRGTSIFI